MNLNHPLEQTVNASKENVAIKHPGGDISYAMIHEAIKRLARGLQKLGINRGDRVAIMLPNVPHFPIAYFAVLRLGAVVVPVNTMYKAREVFWMLEDSEAKALIVWEGFYDELSRQLSVLTSLKNIIILGKEIPPETLSITRLISRSHPMSDIADVDDDDPAVIQYTAGVTGIPKGVELTHGNIMSNAKACREIIKPAKNDEILGALPFFTPMGQTLILNIAFQTGASIKCIPKFEPDEVIEYLKIGASTLFIGVPSMYKILFDAIGDEEIDNENTLRLCICGGGAIPEELLKEFEKKFSTYILECYTTVETSPVVSFNQWRTGRRVGSLGHPIPGVEMKVVDENGEEISIGEIGEIVVKGPNVMRGYVNKPHTTAELIKNGWFHTGDLGKMDINGFFYLVDRKNERIVKGGFSIYPTEIEAVLYGHPDVKEVAVVGIPDETMGQEVKACIVLEDEATVTTEQLAEYCKSRMALYKAPAVIRFYQDLPRTSTGRITKKELIN